METSKTVQTDFGPVIVRKLALGDYAELLKGLKKIPQNLISFVNGDIDFKNSNNLQIIEALLPVIGDSLEEFGDLVAIATDKDAAFIKRLDAGDLVELLIVVFELNNYHKVINAVKKLMARANVSIPKQTKTIPVKEPEQISTEQ